MPGKRILLVEDHADTAAVLSSLLRKQGYAVATAASLAEAERSCAAEKIDLLVCDVQLPDGLAWDLLRCATACSGIPGIVISGRGLPEDLDQSRRAGFLEHLVKPFAIEQFVAAVQRALAHEPRPPTSA